MNDLAVVFHISNLCFRNQVPVPVVYLSTKCSCGGCGKLGRMEMMGDFVDESTEGSVKIVRFEIVSS